MEHTYTFDYSALSEPVRHEDIVAYKTYAEGPGAAKRQYDKSLIGTILFLSVFICFGVIGFIAGDFNPATLVYIAFPGAVIWLVYKSAKHQKVMRAKLHKFAKRNNIQFETDIANPSLTGMIFNFGHSRSVSSRLVLPDGAEVGNYRYVTGSGRNRTQHSWGYCKVVLGRNLPHMVLDSKKNNIFNKISNLPLAISGNVVLELEGDFNKYFSLHVPVGYERDALYVFTPDVMQALVDKGADYDIEIIDNSLMIYRQMNFNLESEAELRKIFDTMTLMSDEVGHQSKRYTDERVTETTANGTIAAAGTRLRNGISPLAIVIGAFVVGIILFQLASFMLVLFSMRG